ncbi:hypothetical protein LIER_09571 [Lithospermum erythrorhizon]|uniref:Uncharacterized protein n=1 Tax=Lithospermum erythrorhizon TaxID=34254 RepID=A0AAV3PG84_LITER
MDVTSSGGLLFCQRAEHTELIDTGESPECLITEVAESCPPALPALTIKQAAYNILRAGVSFLWSCICTWLKEKLPEMILKGEASVMSTFRFLTWMGMGDFPDLHDKLQGFFLKAREADTKLIAASQDKELEQVAAELEARVRDFRTRAQEQRYVMTELGLEEADATQQVDTLEEEIRAEQPSTWNT